MNEDMNKILEQVGLNDREVKIYLATLELGESTVLPIAQKSGIKRTYCYDILDDLIKKDLVSYYEKNGRRRYVASDPKSIKKLIRDRLANFESILPELSALYKPNKEKPAVRFFEGAEEIKKIYDDLLNAPDFAAYGNFEKITQYYPEFPVYAEKQFKRKIPVRDITFRTPENEQLKARYVEHGHELRFLPQNMVFETDNIIYGDKVAMISYGETVHGLVVESKAIAATQRVLFEQLWKISEE